MTNKYELLEDDTINHGGITLYRIRALKDVRDGVPAGTLGGYIYSEFNLSQEGECWVYRGARVVGDAQIRDNATVREHSVISGDVIIRHSAVVRSHCNISGNVEISEEDVLPENTVVFNVDILRAASMMYKGTMYFNIMYKLAGQMQQLTLGADGLSLAAASQMSLTRDHDGVAYIAFNNAELHLVQRNKTGGYLQYGKALESIKQSSFA